MSYAQEMEQDVKAAFVYNFIRFVEWPGRPLPPSDHPINLYILGNDEAADATAALDGKTVRGRKIVVRRVAGVAGIEKCQVLFIGQSVKSQARAILEAVRNLPILTIADFPGFARSGGIVNFVPAEQRLSFEINQVAAERKGLRLSSQLLKVARIVQEAEWR
jgi:hypothetical protein